jgi:hypothetical protein
VPPGAFPAFSAAILVRLSLAGCSGLAPRGSALADPVETKANTAAVVKMVNLIKFLLKF